MEPSIVDSRYMDSSARRRMEAKLVQSSSPFVLFMSYRRPWLDTTRVERQRLRDFSEFNGK